MANRSNPWQGDVPFRGRRVKLPTAKTDKDYLEYCNHKKKYNKTPLAYDDWVEIEKAKYKKR